MKKKGLILFLVTLLLVLWNSYFPTWLLTGTYVSNNNQPILEGPTSTDTLTLYSDGTFKNGAWGTGTYTVDWDKIDFSHSYSMRTAGFQSTIDRTFLIWKPRFSLNRDLGYYYEKK
ncbi:MAG: hypothetical protein AAF740_03610 [Bacteroidota bacterium]